MTCVSNVHLDISCNWKLVMRYNNGRKEKKNIKEKNQTGCKNEPSFFGHYELTSWEGNERVLTNTHGLCGREEHQNWK